MWTHRPRIVLSRRKKPKLNAAQKQAQREERRRIREERREARLRRKERRQDNEAEADGDGDGDGDVDSGGENEEGAAGGVDDVSNREEAASVSESVASGSVSGDK